MGNNRLNGTNGNASHKNEDRSDRRKYRYLQEMYSPFQWIQMPKVFRLAFGPSLGEYLSILIGVDDRCESVALTKHREWDGWFYCTQKQVKFDAFISEESQTKMMKELKQLELVETKLVGVPPVRYIRINYKKVKELANAAKDSWYAKFDHELNKDE